MNDLFNTPIKSQSEAESFIFELVQMGLSFHPEDDAHTIIKTTAGDHLFTPEEADLINQRREELFMYLDDPCETMLETLEKWA